MSNYPTNLTGYQWQAIQDIVEITKESEDILYVR